MKTILAIDPGTSGGIAFFGVGPAVAYAMPATFGDTVALLREFAATAATEGHTIECVLERVGGFVGKGQPGSAMFRFGESFGFLQGVIQTLGIPLVLVRPQDWQKGFSLGTASSCANKRDWKNKLKDEAQRRYPHLKVTLATADALLLGTYHMNFPKQNHAAPCGDLASLLGGCSARK